MKSVGNSKKFYKRLSYYRRKTKKSNPRVPRRTKRKNYKNSRDHSDLFTDEKL